MKAQGLLLIKCQESNFFFFFEKMTLELSTESQEVSLQSLGEKIALGYEGQYI